MVVEQKHSYRIKKRKRPALYLKKIYLSLYLKNLPQPGLEPRTLLKTPP